MSDSIRKDTENGLDYVTPAFLFFLKISINTTFMNTYHCSFNMDQLFPFYKRATSIGICNFVARCFTVAAPLVAELQAPLPIAILLAINGVALLVTFTLSSDDSKEENPTVEDEQIAE